GVERWAAVKKAGAIGIAVLPNPRPPAGTATADQTDSSNGGRGGADRGGRGAALPVQPAVSLADPPLQEITGQTVSVSISRRGAEKFFAGSGHTFEEMEQLVKENQ